MTIKISHSTRGKHRDTQYTATAKVYHNDTHFYDFFMNDIPVTIAELADTRWWLIPSWDDHEKDFVDVGPFDTVDQAAVMLRLQSTGSELIKVV
jgi:hypothetical protein